MKNKEKDIKDIKYVEDNEYVEDIENIENSIIDNEIIAHLIYSNNI